MSIRASAIIGYEPHPNGGEPRAIIEPEYLAGYRACKACDGEPEKSSDIPPNASKNWAAGWEDAMDEIAHDYATFADEEG
jgi:hypothetical protein